MLENKKNLEHEGYDSLEPIPK